MNKDTILEKINTLSENILLWIISPNFYLQIGIILISIFMAYLLAKFLVSNVPLLKKEPLEGSLLRIKKKIFCFRRLLFPIFNIMVLGLAVEFCVHIEQQNWVIRLSQGLAIVFLFYQIMSQFVRSDFVKAFVKWIIIPIAILQVFGWLDNVTTFLESISIHIGNIKLSAYGIVRLFIFGVLLFWLGRISNTTGQQIIRNQKKIDSGTREVFAKLFEITVFVIIFFLLLQVMGINLTTLAVFGGALGVGVGIGLQSIVSNFISGIIILLDRSLTVGDYIQLEDGQTGKIRELNMRFAILESYDGKDIMVPNEQFITNNFINWTHKNQKQRYPLTFCVAYDTDLDFLFDAVREVVASHPKVLSGDDVPIEERPDAEIAAFGDNGIEILVEFWMEGIDDGENRVGADLLYMIWKVLKSNNIEIPYPQRDIRLVNSQN